MDRELSERRDARIPAAAAELVERLRARAGGAAAAAAAAAAAPAAAEAHSNSPEVLLVLKMLDGLSAARRALEAMRKQIEEFVAADVALRTPQPLPDELDMSSAADTLCLLHVSASAQPGGGARGPRAPGPKRQKGCRDLGRLVSVLWVPRGFDEEQEPALKDLVAYRGIVVRDSRAGKRSQCKRGGMLLIKYQDGELAWAKKDRLLKFLD
jgi:hypothetical protein